VQLSRVHRCIGVELLAVMSAYVHAGAERLTTSDWFTSNYALSTDAERGCQASHDVRQEARYLRNETDNKTYWDQVSQPCTGVRTGGTRRAPFLNKGVGIQTIYLCPYFLTHTPSSLPLDPVGGLCPPEPRYRLALCARNVPSTLKLVPTPM